MHTSQKFILQMVCLLLLVGCAGTPAATPTIPPIPTPTNQPKLTAEELAQKISWLRSSNEFGHTAIRIEVEGLVIYVDPVALVTKNLPKADMILITHDHGDHLDPLQVAALSTDATKIVCPDNPSMTRMVKNPIPLTAGQKQTVDGISIEGVAAYDDTHWLSSGFLGYILTIQGVRLYLSGDTALNPEQLALQSIDIAVLNIRKDYSLSGEDAVNFAKTVKPKIIIPIHWMPDADTYGDKAEIDFLRQNIPAGTELLILDLK
jgi:L-ascorbate metabolism protein UlaG (beta-lactamase superfamily)